MPHIAPEQFSDLFPDGSTINGTLTVKHLAAWIRSRQGSRLLLPPIQRSIVWTNEQIINYWDSLLRGYPPGLMIVHRVLKNTISETRTGRDEQGATCEAHENDFQLFDGQQRMATVLLGLGQGQMSRTRKLWIDLGTEPSRGTGLKFQLRISSMGQPFGYRIDAPNQKLELRKRQQMWERWRSKHGAGTKAQFAFENVIGSDLIDASCAVPFAEICALLDRGEDSAAITSLSNQLSVVAHPNVKEFIDGLRNALRSKVIIQLMNPDVVADQEEYVRFFGRLGQGGTRLTDDELTYSIIKNQYPKIHDRMREIMQGKAGRIVGEVDLVMAALRVAKTIAPWKEAKIWELAGRPTPAFVSRLDEKPGVQSKFLEMLPADDNTGTLAPLLGAIRQALSYDETAHPQGLPAILLAHMPRDLVDVLLLLAVMREGEVWLGDERGQLRAFVLHWLLFVVNDSKAALYVFQHAVDQS